MQARVLTGVDECLDVALKALAAPLRLQSTDADSAGDEEIARSDAGLRCCGDGAEPLTPCMP
jgi:hypothetical protein